jgi:hypothetical protein
MNLRRGMAMPATEVRWFRKFHLRPTEVADAAGQGHSCGCAKNGLGRSRPRRMQPTERSVWPCVGDVPHPGVQQGH